jgi:uncharacterized membrane protein YagU involved in acid resistance
MQGVEILTSAQVVTEWSPNMTAFWITVVVVLAVAIISGVIYSIQEYDWSLLGMTTFFGAILGFSLGMFASDVLFKLPVAYETQYKITVSDEVSLTEFYERYEVIDQDGKIFTVREK